MLSITYVKDTPNLHTHTHLGSFGVVQLFSLREEGRRGREGWLKNGVRMKHMIAVGYIYLVFVDI